MNTLEAYAQSYCEKQPLGSGKYGFVCLVHPKDQPEQLRVCKKVRLMGLSEKDIAQQKQEVTVLKLFKHPHVVTVYDDFADEDNVFIVMEYCSRKKHQDNIGGDLLQLIKQRKQGFPQPVVNRWLVQLLMALLYIHQRKVIHRDIKPQNIFVAHNGELKIGDFGVAKVLAQTLEKAKTIIGSPFFLAPEVCSGLPYTQAADIWSLGAVIVELCTLEHAFAGTKLTDIIQNILERKVHRFHSLTDYDPQFVQLVDSMLTLDQSKRPTAKDLLGEPYVIKIIQTILAPIKQPSQDSPSKVSPTKDTPSKASPVKQQQQTPPMEPRKQDISTPQTKHPIDNRRQPSNQEVEMRRQRIKLKMNEFYRQARDGLKEVKQQQLEHHRDSNQKDQLPDPPSIADIPQNQTLKDAPTRVLKKVQHFLQETHQQGDSLENSITIKSEFVATTNIKPQQSDLFDLSTDDVPSMESMQAGVTINFQLENADTSMIHEDIVCEDHEGSDHDQEQEIPELYDLSDSELII